MDNRYDGTLNGGGHGFLADGEQMGVDRGENGRGKWSAVEDGIWNREGVETRERVGEGVVKNTETEVESKKETEERESLSQEMLVEDGAKNSEVGQGMEKMRSGEELREKVLLKEMLFENRGKMGVNGMRYLREDILKKHQNADNPRAMMNEIIKLKKIVRGEQ